MAVAPRGIRGAPFENFLLWGATESCYRRGISMWAMGGVSYVRLPAAVLAAVAAGPVAVAVVLRTG
jgi:hypothetical protein